MDRVQTAFKLRRIGPIACRFCCLLWPNMRTLFWHCRWRSRLGLMRSIFEESSHTHLHCPKQFKLMGDEGCLEGWNAMEKRSTPSKTPSKSMENKFFCSPKTAPKQRIWWQHGQQLISKQVFWVFVLKK